MVETRTVPLEVPADLLACRGSPALPPAAATQRDVAAYVAALWAAWDECRARLAAVGRLVAGQGK